MTINILTMIVVGVLAGTILWVVLYTGLTALSLIGGGGGGLAPISLLPGDLVVALKASLIAGSIHGLLVGIGAGIGQSGLWSFLFAFLISQVGLAILLLVWIVIQPQFTMVGTLKDYGQAGIAIAFWYAILSAVFFVPMVFIWGATVFLGRRLAAFWT